MTDGKIKKIPKKNDEAKCAPDFTRCFTWPYKVQT